MTAAATPLTAATRALRLLRPIGAAFRTTQALDLGIQPRTLYRLRTDRHIHALTRGVFRLASLPEPRHPDLLVVAARVPKAVLCLISALAFHELTDEVPHEVHLALPRGSETPRLDHPPLRIVRLRARPLGAGIETHDIDGLPLRVYSATKTVADCFRFRNLVGLDTALAALKRLRRRRGFDVEELLRHARIDRVERTVRPYVEALL